MAWDATKTTKTFQIFGIPESGTGYVEFCKLSLWGPAGEVYDFAAIVDYLNAAITDLSASATRTVQAEAMLTRWDAIGPTSVIEIWKSSTGAEGSIVDHQRELKLIRKELANLLGFANFLSFFDEARRFQGNSISR